jgi:predicted dehydrogenase
MTYNIGLVGCGGIAGSWINAVAAHGECQIILAYDLAADAAARRAAETGAQATDGLDALLGDERIDLVIIGTPTPSHPALVEQAARAGKHVLCEKPMIVQAVVGFESGALVTLRTGSTVALPTRGYWIGGTEGGLRFTEWGGPIGHYRTDFSEKRLVSAKATNAYYLELCDFLQAVEKGGEPGNSPLNGKKNIALGLGIYYSFETSRRLEYRQGMPVEMPVDYQNTRW